MVIRSALFLLQCCLLFILCPTADAQDSCAPITYQHLLSGNGVSLNATDMILAADGKGTVIAGQAGPAGGEADAWLAAFDENANTRWSFRYHPDTASFYKVVTSSDGYYIAIGLVGSKAHKDVGFLQVKVDTTGNILWSKKYFLTANPGGSTLSAIIGLNISSAIATSDGGLAFCGTDGSVVKTGADGSLQWAKSVTPILPNNAPMALLQNGDTLLVADNGSPFGATASFLLKLSVTDGRLLGATQLGSANILRLVTVFSMEKKDGLYRVNCFSPSITASRSDPTIFCYDMNGRLLSTRQYDIPAILLTSSAQVTLTTGGEWGGSTPGAAAGPFYAIRLPETVGARTGSIFTGNAHMFSLQATADKGFVAAGSSGSPLHNVLLIKADSAGKTPGCNTLTTDFVTTDVPILTLPVTLVPPADQTYLLTTLATSLTDAPVSKTPLCPVSNCSTLHITGFDSICMLQVPVPYRIQKNAGCFLPVRWRVNTDSALLQDITDSTVNVVFKKQGAVVLHADMISGCTVVSDSLLISVQVSPPFAGLGPDIAICKAGAVRLSAGPGFKSYRWQDGSTDSVFIAGSAGQYSIIAEDYCGSEWKDTVTITRGIDLAFDMGPDRQSCDNDTLVLQAPTGFARYSWLPEYNIHLLNPSSAKLWPGRDTSYTVTAWTASNCMVMDTVRITVLPSPAAQPVSDTGICAGQSVVLQARAGFAFYQWQNGAEAPLFTATKPGVYWVQVTDGNGCRVTDTLLVYRPKGCKQHIYFPNGFTPDNNGHNDSWRPVVLGDLASFQLLIYNRFGQKVFQSINPLQGWDGGLGGKPQAAGAFVWVCTYRFDGETLQTERGSFLLLR